MTDEKLDRAIALKQKISELEDILDQLNSKHYRDFTIQGVCEDGVWDHVCHIPRECVEVIQQWYSNEWTRRKEEFEAL